MSYLIDRLVDELGYPRLDTDTFDAFAAAHEHAVAFFTEDPRAFTESSDVAVILPELMRVYGHRLAAGVVDRGAERALHRRFRFRTWPALVFLRRGAYVGVITGVQDWTVFLEEFERLLAAGPVAPPRADIPVTTAGRPAGCAGGC